jgi:hypothetical protein
MRKGRFSGDEGGLLVRLRLWENVRERGVRRGDLQGGVEGLGQRHNNEVGKYSVSKKRYDRRTRRDTVEIFVYFFHTDTYIQANGRDRMVQ